MCYSFNDEANRKAFLADEDAYCAKYGLNQQQRQAIANKNVLELLAAGGKRIEDNRNTPAYQGRRLVTETT